MKYKRIKSTAGDEVYAYCPLDEAFVEDFLNTVCELAKTGTEFIMFEDDYTLSGGKVIEVGCCCDRHMDAYCKLIGEKIDISKLRKHLLFESENKCRSAWLDSQ